MRARIGFSTSDAWYSRIIRRFTKSEVSHTFLLVEVLGRDLVFEEGPDGFHARTVENFSKGNRIVRVIEPKYPIDAGVEAAFVWLGQRYDYVGLLGMFFVMVARWFGKKIHNPMSSASSMFCSEAGARVLQLSGYPGSEALDPAATTPMDLMEFLSR